MKLAIRFKAEDQHVQKVIEYNVCLADGFAFILLPGARSTGWTQLSNALLFAKGRLCVCNGFSSLVDAPGVSSDLALSLAICAAMEMWKDWIRIWLKLFYIGIYRLLNSSRVSHINLVINFPNIFGLHVFYCYVFYNC